jgi:hypothetical protein
MRFTKFIQRRIRKQGNGVDVAGDVNAAIAANVGERGAQTRASSSQRIVQRSSTKGQGEAHIHQSNEGGLDV